MTIKEELTHIIYNESDESLISFFKSYSLKERSKFMSILMKFQMEFSNDLYITYAKPKSDVKYLDRIKIAIFFSSNKQLNNFHLPKYDVIDTLLEHHCPSWLSDLVNEPTSYCCPYNFLVKWIKLGYIKADKQSITRSMLCIDNMDELKKYNSILEEHIWYLFEFPTGIRWNKFWRNIFCFLSDQGLLSRKRLIKEILAIAHRNFKTLGGLFFDILVELKLTHEELIEEQDGLFSALTCDYSKVVNVTLDFCKSIIMDPRFNTNNFINQLNFLLNVETKSVLKTTLGMVDILMNLHPELVSNLQFILTNVFSNKEESIQIKAAHLILKYPIENTQTFEEALMPYHSTLLTSSKKLFKDYLVEDVVTFEQSEFIEDGMLISNNPITENNAIFIPTTIDDLIFYAGQVFIGKDLHYKEVFLSSLVNISPKMGEDDWSKLIPTCKLAIEVLFNSESYEDDKLMSGFFISLLNEKFKNNPIQLKSILDIRRIAEKKAFRNNYQSINWYEQRLKNEKNSEEVAKYEEYVQKSLEKIEIMKKSVDDLIEWKDSHNKLSSLGAIFIHADYLLNNNLVLPLLSTPTHIPLFIDSKIYEQRLKAYSSIAEKIDDSDNQLALKRIYKEVPENLFQQGCSYKVNHNIRRIEVHIPKQDVFYNQLSRFHHDITYKIDIPYIVASNPYQHDAPLLLFCEECFYISINRELNIFIKTLEVIYDIGIPYTKVGHLFLSIALFHDNRSIRDYAIGIFSNKPQLVDPEIMGEIFADFILKKISPITRFTDPALKQLIGSNSLVDRLMEQVLVFFILKLDQEVIHNLKKVLELYAELIDINKSQTSKLLIPQLEFWKNISILKIIVGKLLNS